MSSPVISVPSSPASPDASVVQADDWYPDIDCNAARDALRLGEVVTHARLVAAIESGMISVMGELAQWRALQDEAGHTNMAAVSAATVNGQNRLELLFIRAVRMAAAAEMAELHRDITATDEGDQRADAQVQTAADYRRLTTLAVRDIIGVSRTAVELI